MTTENGLDLDELKLELMKAMAVCEMMTCLEDDREISSGAVKMVGFGLLQHLGKAMECAGIKD